MDSRRRTRRRCPSLSLQTHRARDCELILSWKASTPPVLAMAHFVLFDPPANCL